MTDDNKYMSMPFNSLVELDDGDPAVALAIGARFLSGDGVAADREKGRGFLRYAAMSGSEAQKAEAVALLRAKAVRKTAELSGVPVSMLLSKANLSDRDAIAEIFRRYFNDRGKYADVIGDTVRNAVELNFCGSEIAAALGRYYEESKNSSEAFRWYRNAADCSDSADVLNKLSYVWRNGTLPLSTDKVTAPDAVRAAVCQMRAAENGSACDAAVIAGSILDKKKGFEKYLPDIAEEWLMKGVSRFGDSAGVPFTGEELCEDTVDYIVNCCDSDPESAQALLDVACKRLNYRVESNPDLERFYISRNRTEYCYHLAGTLIELDEEANRDEILSLMGRVEGENHLEAMEYCAKNAYKNGDLDAFVRYYSEVEVSPKIPSAEIFKMAVSVFAADKSRADFDRAFSAMDEYEKYSGDAEDLTELSSDFKRFCELQSRCAKNKNDAGALFELGKIYYYGINVHRNEGFAVNNFIFPAAKLKNKDAICFLLDNNNYFDFTRKDDYKTILGYGAELGIPKSAFHEAFNCLKKGDYDNVLKFFESAKPYNREACVLNIAKICCSADYSGRDTIKGVRMLLEEARDGSEEAEKELRSESLREISEVISRADSGSAEAQNELGHRLLEGAGIEQNAGRAVEFFDKASAEIAEAAEILAQYYLGERDIDSCDKYLDRAKKLGSAKYKRVSRLHAYEAEKLIRDGRAARIFGMAEKLINDGRRTDGVAEKVRRVADKDTATALYRLCDWLRLNGEISGKDKKNSKGFGFLVCAVMRDEGRYVEADYELTWDYCVAGSEIGYRECREMLYDVKLEEFGKYLRRVRDNTASYRDYMELAQIYSDRNKDGRESARVGDYRKKAAEIR